MIDFQNLYQSNIIKYYKLEFIKKKDQFKIQFLLLYFYIPQYNQPYINNKQSHIQKLIQKMSLRKSRVALQGVSNHSLVNLKASKKWFNKSQLLMSKSKVFQTNDKKAISKTATANKKHQQTLMMTQSASNLSKYAVPNLKSTSTNYQQIHLPSHQPHQTQSSSKLKTFLDRKQIQHHKRTLFPKGRLCYQANLISNDSSNIEQNMTSKTKILLNSIRNTYKYNANVRKIIKAWGFQSKGCVSQQKFQQIISKHFDPTITKNQCQQLMNEFSNNNRNIDLLSFIKMVFDSEPFTKPHVQVLDDQNGMKTNKKQLSPQKTLIKKINDLNQASLQKCINKKTQEEIRLPALVNTAKQEMKKWNQTLNASQNYNVGMMTQPSLYQSMHSSSSPKFSYFTTKAHGIDFNPLQFTNVNQQKTRFNATPLLQLNDQSLPQHKRQKILDQKYKVIQQLSNQRSQQKLRYQNKLQKIRQHQQQQKQNIQLIDRKFMDRDQANMKKTRQQNIAYNYVNFIHNDWK